MRLEGSQSLSRMFVFIMCKSHLEFNETEATMDIGHGPQIVRAWDWGRFPNDPDARADFLPVHLGNSDCVHTFV